MGYMIPLNRHEHGLVTTYEGSIVSHDLTKIYDEIAIVIDISTGCFHKVGKPLWLKDYYNTMVAASNRIDPEFSANLIYIEFNPKTGCPELDNYLQAKLSKDEICTLINYFANCIGKERMNQILNMDADTLHKELAKLAEFGF